MWQQMKKTFVPVQILVAAVVTLICIRTGNWPAALLTALAMEVGNYAGVAWGERLRGRLKQRPLLSPLRR